MTETQTPEPASSRPERPPVSDRTISPIAGRLGPPRPGRGLALAGLLVGCGIFLAVSWGRETAPESQARQPPARQIVSFEPLLSERPPTLTAPRPDAPSLGEPAADASVPALQPAGSSDNAPSRSDVAAARRAELAEVRGAPILAYSHGGSTRAAPELPGEPRQATELEQLRQGSAIGRARAFRLPDRRFLIVAGTAIPCVLQTAMDTATPGYVSCLIPRDVLSDNGAVVLMEKGTRVLGEYRSSLRQGRRRLFVLWTRAVTPEGVAISLASPASDALGRGGFDGDIDTHFWERFGGALLVSIVDNASYGALGRQTGDDAVRVPSDAAGIALQNSIDIPPSLRKAQGAEVAIFVAQDFDFSSVYGLRDRAP